MKTPVALDQYDDMSDADGLPLLCMTLADKYERKLHERDPRDEAVVRINAYPRLVESLKNIIACCNANDGDALANAVNDSIDLLDQLESKC